MEIAVTDLATIDFDPAGDQWIAIHENHEDAPDGVLIGCADERPDIPDDDPSMGGVIHLRATWAQLAELHATIADVLTRRPA